jgi:hypothetical protein
VLFTDQPEIEFSDSVAFKGEPKDYSCDFK